MANYYYYYYYYYYLKYCHYVVDGLAHCAPSAPVKTRAQ